MGESRRFVRESAGEEARRQSLLQSVGDVREVMFTLLERAHEVSAREPALVDALQALVYELGVVEARLHERERHAEKQE